MKKTLLTLLLLSTLIKLDAQAPTLVYDITPGSGNSFPDWFVVFGPKLVFKSNTGGIMEYDGINPPSAIPGYASLGLSQPQHLFVFNGKVYFNGFSSTTGAELYVYDGTNTSLAADIVPGMGNSSPAYFAIFQSKLYFSAVGKLYCYDGVNAPAPIARSTGGDTEVSSYTNFKVYNNKLYFGGGTPGLYDLWMYDGTNPASLVTDINTSGNADPRFFEVFNNKLYFSASTSASGNELWVYDGINPSTQAADINSGNADSDPIFLTAYNNNLYFTARAASGGDELYVYDGTNAPSMVYDLNFSGGSTPENLTVFNGVLYFGADVTSFGHELCAYNGTGNPAIIADIWSGSLPGYGGGNLAQFNNKIYFCGNEGTNGFELWSFDLGVGLNENIENANITVFPNPSAGATVIDLGKVYDNVLMEVFNAYGECVENRLIENTQTINLSVNGGPGVYFLRISMAGSYKTVTFVKS